VKGDVMAGDNDNIRILTDEEEAFRISRELSKAGPKFNINPVTLDDIFFYIIAKEGGKQSCLTNPPKEKE